MKSKRSIKKKSPKISGLTKKQKQEFHAIGGIGHKIAWRTGRAEENMIANKAIDGRKNLGLPHENRWVMFQGIGKPKELPEDRWEKTFDNGCVKRYLFLYKNHANS